MTEFRDIFIAQIEGMIRNHVTEAVTILTRLTKVVIEPCNLAVTLDFFKSVTSKGRRDVYKTERRNKHSTLKYRTSLKGSMLCYDRSINVCFEDYIS